MNIIRKLTIIAFIIGVLSPLLLFAAAPTLLMVDGSTSWERARVLRLESRLNFTHEPMTDNWSLTIWPQDQFEKYVREHGMQTSIAFTFLGENHTYINEYFLIWANDQQVEFVMGHEAGHIICECRSEDKAEMIAHVLTGLWRPNLEH